MILYNKSQQRLNAEYKFMAALHGAKVKDDKDGFTRVQAKDGTVANVMKFGDPNDYSHMSVKEKQELTDKMKGGHTRWVGSMKMGQKKTYAK